MYIYVCVCFCVQLGLHIMNVERCVLQRASPLLQRPIRLAKSPSLRGPCWHPCRPHHLGRGLLEAISGTPLCNFASCLFVSIRDYFRIVSKIMLQNDYNNQRNPSILLDTLATAETVEQTDRKTHTQNRGGVHPLSREHWRNKMHVLVLEKVLL